MAVQNNPACDTGIDNDGDDCRGQQLNQVSKNVIVVPHLQQFRCKLSLSHGKHYACRRLDLDHHVISNSRALHYDERKIIFTQFHTPIKRKPKRNSIKQNVIHQIVHDNDDVYIYPLGRRKSNMM